MDARQRQYVLFIGFMFIFTVVTLFLLNNLGVEGPSLGNYVPESTKQFASNTTDTWGEIADDVKNGSQVLG